MNTRLNFAFVSPDERRTVSTRSGAVICWWVVWWTALGLVVAASCPSLAAAPGDKKWEFQTGGPVVTSPAIGADGTVYVGSHDGKVYALNGVTGAKQWEFLTVSWVHSSPAIGVDGTVYVGSHEHEKVYALNGATGAKQWESLTVSSVNSSPAIGADGTVYVGVTIGVTMYYRWVYALNGVTGFKQWEFRADGYVSSTAIGADGTVYVGSSGGKVYALNGATGAKQWEFLTGGLVISSPAIGVDGTVYVGSWDSKVYALNGVTGAKRWEFQTGSWVRSSPAIGADGTVYIGSDDRRFYSLNGATGAKRWEFQTGGKVYSSPAIGADGTVYVGSSDSKVYALNGVTGAEQWEFLTGGEVNPSPAIGADGTVYVGSNDGKVYALEGSSPGGLAKSPWPKFHGNAQNTGRQNQYGPQVFRLIGNQVRKEGSRVEMTVQVQGFPVPSIQWHLNGQPIPGATGTVYAIASVSDADVGTYTVVASNALGTATSDAMILNVNNVETASYPGLIITASAGTQLQVQYANELSRAPLWQLLADLTLSESPYVYVDKTAAGAAQRLYRTTHPDPLTLRMWPGWVFDATAGSRHRIEYVDELTGFLNWQLLTTLTLPESPYLFIDTSATNVQRRHYRTTPAP